MRYVPRRAILPTDSLMRRLRRKGSGVCFATAYLRADGAKQPDTELELIIRQLDYLITRLGEDRVGLGSDFDGTFCPSQKMQRIRLIWSGK